MTGGCDHLTSMVPTCHSDSNRKEVFIHSLRIILIILFALPALARVPEPSSRQSLTIIMPSYSFNAPLGEGWTVDQDDKTENVSFKKSATQPYMSSILQVIKKTVANKNKALSEPEMVENLFRDEESKLQKELVEKQLYDLKEIKKGKTTIGGKKLDYMSYKAAKDKVGVDAILYVYFPENYRKIQAFYVFFISEAYLKGSYEPDLTKIHPLVTSFKTSDHVVPRQATIDDLLVAVGDDDIPRAKDMLDEGLDVNGRNEDGWSAMMIAASKGNLAMMKLLIEKGAAVDEKNSQGQTPLIFAAHWGHADAVRLLIANGANVNSQMNDGWTALIDAIGMDHVAVSKLLIESGADINLESTNGWTALMEAAYKNNVPITKLLIENGADVNAKDAMNNTALNIAKTKGYGEIVKLLIEHPAKE